MTVEITEQDIIDMKKGFQAMTQKVEGLDVSNLATKNDVEICIGAECKKLSTSIGEVKEAQGNLQGRVDHIDELVHKGRGFQPPPRDAHLAAQRKAAQAKAAEEKKHGHADMKAMADCPDCFPGMKDAVVPKLLEEGYREKAFKLSELQRDKLRKKGIPTCDGCGIPWLETDAGEVEKECQNCGEKIDDPKK